VKLAIITGASSGIGREFARQLRASGEADAFWLIARREDRLAALAKELDCPCRIIPADLTAPEGIAAVTDALAAERPAVRYLINCAGFGKFGGFSEVAEQDVIHMIDLNVKALVLLTHRVLPYMERGGRILEMGSGSCFTPLPYFNIYASTKSFVLHYTKGLRDEIRPLGVTATCFCPGWVGTEFLDIAERNPDVTHPKSGTYRPLLRTERVVRGAIRAMQRGKTLYATNWYTKLQHLMFKILPDRLLTRVWLGRLTGGALHGKN